MKECVIPEDFRAGLDMSTLDNEHWMCTCGNKISSTKSRCGKCHVSREFSSLIFFVHSMYLRCTKTYTHWSSHPLAVVAWGETKGRVED